MADLTTWPTWEIQFDRSGNVNPAARAALLTEIPGAGLTDLVGMSHGWNSSPDHSRKLEDDSSPTIMTTCRTATSPMATSWPAETRMSVLRDVFVIGRC